MKSISTVYNEFVKQTLLPVDWKQQLYSTLSSYKPEDIKTLEEHRMFVEALHKLRSYNAEDMKLNGKKFLDTIASLLAVGNDGLYSSDLRFIYELIQNVDDCEYADIEDCHLDIKFEYDPAPGRIILIYNETGFKPFNVFAITGIAEESKNVSADKVEIGEKGIGFKSVFGVAKKVYIESGMFSFELYKDNFTVPIPKYDGYKPFKGTRLTIYPDSMHNAKTIHEKLLRQYEKKDAILNQNPILFLNKLTHLKMYFDGWRFIEFDVEKRKISSREEIIFEDEVLVSVDMHSAFNGRENQHNSIISCRRYTMPITYGESECKSRYGDDIQFTERKHNLIAVFPILDEKSFLNTGLLYSFLPTQIKIAAPLVLHVPYKLDGSRQFVDQQGYNAWFKFTNEKLAYFLKKIYVDLARRVKSQIIRYLPSDGAYFFKHDNDKVKCIQNPDLKATEIYKQDIFYCLDGSFGDAEHVVSFEKGFVCDNSDRVFELLDLDKKLFVPYSNDVDMSSYKVTVLKKVMETLFENGLSDGKNFAEIADILDKLKQPIAYFNIIADKSSIVLSQAQVEVIASHKRILKNFIELSERYIERGKLPSLSFNGNWTPVAEASKLTIIDLVETADLDAYFEKYVQSTQYKFLELPNKKSEFYLAGSNGIVLSKEEPLGSFGSLSAHFDPNNTFSSTLKIRQASDKLNNASESMSNVDYLKLLRGVRNSLVGAFGKKAYSSYISIINSAGSDKSRFLFELLQNADDCTYPKNVTPTFDLKIAQDVLSVSYNEVGFTKDNVRAITAIGESTKKLLLNGQDRAIGEKGVGFKSVFGVANSVDIHSNGFDFRLTSELPTVPEKIAAISEVDGTLMEYKLKDRNIGKVFTEEKILYTCLCLRNLKKISILGINVSIEDTDNTRIITIQGKRYEFERIIYSFDVEDENAIDERNFNQKSVSKHQYIACYIPPKEFKYDKLTLYSGLPVSKVECNIPLVIDAPFELTTSRDDVLESLWNDCIYDALYEAIINVIETKKVDMKLDVLKYVHYQNQNGTISFPIFNKQYLNGFGWLKQLQTMEIIPLLGKESFVRPDGTKRIIPEIIASVIDDCSNAGIAGSIVDTRKKSQYIPLLESLGCKRLLADEEIKFFKANLNRYLEDKKQREAFYDYLVSRRAEYDNKNLSGNIRKLEIYPIRTASGYRFIEYVDNIYTHTSKVSTDEFLVLDTAVMSYEICQGILGLSCRINQLSQEVYDAKYRKKIEDMITSNKSNEEIAKFLLKEFKTNFEEFKKCKISLVGLLDDIPMEMASGEFNVGNKYINEHELILEGPLLKEMYVSEKYRSLAEFLGCTDILLIHYSDIDYDFSEVSDTDIEDILGDFKYYIDILGGMIEDGILTDEQIEKFNLQFLSGAIDDSDDDYDENFPGKKVADIKRLRSHIKDIFMNSPNPYVYKKRIVREPRSKVNKQAYTTAMYGSQYNEKKCFCQMCQNLVKLSHIERNDVQKKPKYGWDQMYLSLCLNCSKDYVFLRNNPTVWKNFIAEILSVDVANKSTIEIEIADRTIAFTATHLAEIQEIFRLEAEDQRDFKDEMIDATDEYEEEDDDSEIVLNRVHRSLSIINDIPSHPDDYESEEDVDEYDEYEDDEEDDDFVQRLQSISELEDNLEEDEKLIVVKEGWFGDYCFFVDKIIDGKAYGLLYKSGKPYERHSTSASSRVFRSYEGKSREKIEKDWKEEDLVRFWSNRGFTIVDERPLGVNKYLFVKGSQKELKPWVEIVRHYYNVNGHFQPCRVFNMKDGWGTISSK